MTDQQEEIGDAQVDFRNANDVIQASADRFILIAEIPFICECSDRACSELVRLSFDMYDAIRQHPRRFFTVSGHERSSVEAGAERIVAVIQDLTIVEKIGVAGEIAADAHPRGS